MHNYKQVVQAVLITGLLFLLGTGLGRLSGQQQFPGGNSGGVSLTPVGTNQTITPGDTTSIPLTIKEASGTTSVQDFQILSTGGATLFSISTGGTTISTQATSIGGWGGSTLTLGTSTGIINMGTRTLKIGNDNFTHLTMSSANNDIAGTLTCATSTVTKTFAVAYTSTPTIVLEDDTTTGGARVSTKSNTAFTVTCTGATDVVEYIVIGNPN